jgi:hypothetical protein
MVLLLCQLNNAWYYCVVQQLMEDMNSTFVAICENNLFIVKTLRELKI